MLSRKKLSRLVFRDNGLPDSYGILLDNITVEDAGKHPNYDECSHRYKVGSKVFNSCIDGEISLDDYADSLNTAIYKQKGQGLVDARSNLANAFVNEPAKNGKTNFIALGLGGKVVFSYRYEHSKRNALIDVYGKTLKMREITWGNATLETYPESAIVRAKLEHCHDESLNGINEIATLSTKQHLNYKFETNENGQSFVGCKLIKVIVKDTTPAGPSKDGIDINSVQLVD